jgi:ACS family pantothenate transporter-like MFS transporter
MLTSPFPLPVLVTAAIQLLLWRDKRRAAKVESEGLPTSQEGDSPQLQASDVDEKKAVRTSLVNLD